VADAALVYHCLQGNDALDTATQAFQAQDVLTSLRDGVRGLRLAFAETTFWDQADAEVVQAVRSCGDVFTRLGAQVTSVSFPEAAEAQALNPRGLVVAAEVYTLHQARIEAHLAAYDPIVSQRMIQGKQVTASEYLHTTRAWTALRTKVQRTLQDVDALLVPTTMIPAVPVAEADASMEAYTTRNLQYLRNTAIGNILNLCGLSLPCGFTTQGLPIGLMIYGKPFHEAMILRVGYAFEQATDWHRRTPDLAWISS
jgi:aspartyl-tRNA(Asn)/glutamyl-tRNA(Gln) amidotransferase subunit A